MSSCTSARLALRLASSHSPFPSANHVVARSADSATPPPPPPSLAAYSSTTITSRRPSAMAGLGCRSGSTSRSGSTRVPTASFSTATKPRPARAPVPPSDRRNERTLYDVLGLPAAAGGEEIKTAYRRLALELHPDRVAVDKREESIKLFCEVRAAYAVLGDRSTRAAYDACRQSSLGMLQQEAAVRRRPTTADFAMSSAMSYARPSTRLGRNWETDQCWC